MIQSKSLKWSLIENRGLFILKLDTPGEGSEQIYATVDELEDLRDFLNEVPIGDKPLV